MSQPWYNNRVSQPYGVNGEQGVDIATPFHTPITNVFPGTVVEENYGSAGGVVGILTNLPGLGQVVEYFLHLDLINVVQGQVVKAGQLIGLSGGENAQSNLPGYVAGGLHPVTNPALSSGPHTEFGFFAHTPLFVGSSVGNPYADLAAGTGRVPQANDAGGDPTFGATQAAAVFAATGATPGTNARFAVAAQPSDGGSTWWQVFLRGLGMGLNENTNAPSPITNVWWSTFLRVLGMGLNETPIQDATRNASNAVSQWLQSIIQEAGFFILALMLVIIGIVLIAHGDDNQPVFQGLVKKGAT